MKPRVPNVAAETQRDPGHGPWATGHGPTGLDGLLTQFSDFSNKWTNSFG